MVRRATSASKDIGAQPVTKFVTAVDVPPVT